MLIIGGRDAGIEAALQDKQLRTSTEVTLLVANRYRKQHLNWFGESVEVLR